ncbi:predicted protein [Naegleria gruberi]|uniref:Predicted protein n=1 Tax=Naegleria gruberi TaxID=5762 RepID=D2V642_NAEGR|nr:uncharacterized protein NAEGRDRAFT_64303 [Naegleria gruberi]EFC47901.1 predicted protein [Naegleria gruberi]|eukprot:XP_002680645.1 predicted protein [Naegleria gruberi strain NEG-M]
MQQRDDERLITSPSNDLAHHTSSSSIQHDEEMCTLFFFLGFLMNIVWIVNFVKYRNSDSPTCKKLALASIILFGVSSVIAFGLVAFGLYVVLTWNPRVIA